MDAEIRTTLSKLGLNGKEIRIYLALLSIGSAPASVLGKKTDIVRSTAKYTCDQLQRKKLFSVVNKDGTDWYTIEPPKKIFLLLEEQKRELEQKTTAAQGIISALEHLHNPHSVVPKVQFFEGKDGLIKLYDQILDLSAPIDSFEDNGEMAHFIPDYVQKFIEKRKERKIFNRVICPAKNPINKSTPQEFRETRTIHEKLFPLTCDIKICQDLVTIFSFEKNTAVGIAIRHKDISQNFRILFEHMWKNLE